MHYNEVKNNWNAQAFLVLVILSLHYTYTIECITMANFFSFFKNLTCKKRSTMKRLTFKDDVSNDHNEQQWIKDT